MSQMLEDLLLAPGLRTLEIGAGTGYNAALLAHVVGPGRLVSVDVNPLLVGPVGSGALAVDALVELE